MPDVLLCVMSTTGKYSDEFIMQHANEKLIEAFYTAFQQLDWRAMTECYHPDIGFSDPVFTSLSGEQVGDMWHMLCSRARDFELHYSHIYADDTMGSARWVASYRFPQTGRRVKNIIFAEFQFSGGKIIRHSDHFNFWRWSISALGMPGLFMGWSGLLRRKVQLAALSGLRAFSAKLHKQAS